jgi:hypothetical protein
VLTPSESTIERVSYLNQIKELVARQDLQIGINFMKPWEEIEMDDYYLIEYLFVGRLITKNTPYIIDQEIGVNFNLENRFGQSEFESEDIINLTLLINKNKCSPIKEY